MKIRGRCEHPLAAVRRATRRRAAGEDEQGFTLIELLVVVVVLPIVIGGIAAALLSVFGLQTQTMNRIGDSNDELVSATNFSRDVQSAAQLTTQSTPGCGASSQTQLLGIEWGPNSTAPGGYQTVVSYVTASTVNSLGKTVYSLVRQQCDSGTSTSPNTDITVSSDLGSSPSLHIYGQASLVNGVTTFPNVTSQFSAMSYTYAGTNGAALSTLGTLTLNSTTSGTSGTGTIVSSGGTGTVAWTGVSGNTLTGSTYSRPGTDTVASGAAVVLAWHSTQGVTKVELDVTEPGSNFIYSLVGLPSAGVSQGTPQSATPVTTGNDCNFANSGTGTYASQLCFVDFTGFNNTVYSASNPNQCQEMSGQVENSPYSISFCISVTPNTYSPANTPYQIAPTAWPIPTYGVNAGFNSEAFLGNNGFYTGIPGNPALYQKVNWSNTNCGGAGTPTHNGTSCSEQQMTVVHISDFQVFDAAGQPATGWTLVTGYAESTDTGEWMVFQNNSGINWSVLYNAGLPAILFGNSRFDTNDPSNYFGFMQYTG